MDNAQPVLYIIFLIFTGTAILSTLALFTRQSLLVAYILLGAILGPWGLKLVKDSALIKETGNIGIIFLLFLLGLNLQPQNLFHSLLKMSRITLLSSGIFLIFGFLIGVIFNFDVKASLIIGICMMFSSTIIGLKLLPTTDMHHQHSGELMISILLLQDLIAIGVLLVLQIIGNIHLSLSQFYLMLGGIPILIFAGYLFERLVLNKLFQAYNKIHEYIFILSLGWCLGMAEIAHAVGLPEEVGAFIAGIVLATNPISFYIAESLKPLRDFFLVIFFFTIGAGFNVSLLPTILLPAFTLAILMLIIKPPVFCWLLKKNGERKALGWEIGVRLGQISEFSLLIVFLGLQMNVLAEKTTYLVQTAMIFTFIVSCYWIALKYPTPLASSDKLRRD